jgi:hypothetical protein
LAVNVNDVHTCRLFVISSTHFLLSSREEELKEELALGITMALNAWHLHIGILKVTQYHSDSKDFSTKKT